MSTLLEFLADNPVDNITEDVVISQRLAKYPFKIRAMTGDEFTEYQKMATTFGRHKKASFDSKLFNEQVIINHTVEPNFKDAATLKKAGCTTPQQFINKCLLAGEISELTKRISALSGFDTEINEVVSEAKNS